MKKMIGFGDYLLRLNPEGYLRFQQADRMAVNYTGAEANVCVSLSVMGMETAFVTRLPDNDITRCGLAQLNKHRVDTSRVVFGGERMGLFYLEKGASQRPSKVIYDRKFTSIATASPEDFNWDAIFDGASWFHFTGITPALGEHLPDVCADACRTAQKHGITVSCDLNYRKNLWTVDRAHDIMSKLLPYVDVVIANEEDCEKVLGIKAADSDVIAGELSPEGYAEVARKLTEQFGVSCIGITLRRSLSASDNEWSAMYYTDSNAYFSKKYPIHIVDRVGGGDSFSAGLLYAIAHAFDPQKAVEFAAAASCLKHTIEMDYNLSTVDEIMRLMEGDGSGRVQR